MPRVAAIQMQPVFKDRPSNIRKAMLLVAQAAKAGAEVIVLPELCTTGYSFMSADEARPHTENLGAFRPGQDSPDCLSMGVFYRAAKRFGVYIVWGLAEREAGTDKLFNSQVLMTPDGTWESYRKVNFFGNDFLWAHEGRANPPVVATPHGKVGLLICRDVRDKSTKLDSFYEKGDADIVAFSANWGKGGFPATHWMDFAKDNKVQLIVSNRYGLEVHNDFGLGGSCVISPDGKVSCEGLVWGEDCIVLGEV